MYEKLPLKARRVAAGLTQKELAEKTGLKLSTIINIECGNIKANSEMINAILDFFKLPYEAFKF